MAKKRPEGICHICGSYGLLTFEHVPPHAAFNNRRVVTLTFEQAITLGPDEQRKPTTSTSIYSTPNQVVPSPW